MFYKELIDFLIDKWPVIGISVVTLAFVWWASWKASKYHSSIEDVKTKVGNLPCDSHTEQLTAIKGLSTTVSSTNNIVTEMSQWIMKQDKNMVNVLIKKCSPYIITQIGRKLLADSGGEKAVDDNIDFLFSEIDDTKPTTPYDVEDQAIKVIIKNIGHEMFRPIKQFIYYSPDTFNAFDPETEKERTINVSLPSILHLMGIHLRDRYMEEHPEIEKI